MKKKIGKLVVGLFALVGVLALVGVGLVGLMSREGPLLASRGAPSLTNLLPGRSDNKSAAAEESLRTSGSAAAPAPGLAVSAPAMRAAAPPAQVVPPSPVDLGQRLIVRNGSLVLLVDDVAEAATKARRLAEAYPDGFVVTSVQREENGRPAATVTIRVPARQFEEALEKLKALAVRVQNEQVASRDVTEEFVDTGARLRNLQATEQRYLALLQQARTVEDILKIEQQLSNVRGQIEQLQGRLQFLERSAMTSVITIDLRPYAASQTAPADWSLLPVVSNAWGALLSTLRWLAAALVWVGIFAPVWLPPALLVWWWRRRRSARRAAPASP